MKKKILATALTIVLLLAFSAVAFAETSTSEWDVTFTDENKLESNYNTAAGLSKVYDMQPGDTVELKLNLSNSNGSASNWYLSNAVLQSLEESKNSASGGAYEYELVYTGPSGAETVLYTSDTVGGEQSGRAGSDRVGLKNATEGLEDFVYLDTLEANAKATVRLRVLLDGETQGNSYQDTLARLQLNFAVDPIVTREEVVTRTDSNVVRTGDLDASLPFLIIAGVSGLLLLVLAVMGLRERKGAKKSARKVMSLLLVGALVCASPALSMAAHAAEGDAAGGNGLTYTVRLYPGAQGTIDQNAIVTVVDGQGCRIAMENGVCVLRDLPYGAKVTFNAYEGAASGVTLNGTENAGSKYYVRGVRESGQDNSMVDPAAVTVTGDMDYVVAYGIRGEMVSYTIRFEDEDGNELAPALERHGNIGDKPIVAYQYIEGYRPQAYNLAKTLVQDASENVFTFTYRPIDMNVTVQTVYAPGGTTVEPAPGVEAPTALGPGGEEIPEEETPLAPPEEVIDLDDTPLASGFFDPMAGLIDDFATMLEGLPMAVRLGLSVCIAALGAWIILLFVRRKKEKKDAKAS